MREHKVFLLSLGFLLVFLGIALAASTFNPEAGTATDHYTIYLSLMAGGLTALALYYKKTFLDQSVPSFSEWEAALADYSKLKYGKDFSELSPEERVNLKKDFLERFGGYTYFTEDEINYMKTVNVPSPLPSWEEFGLSVASGAAVGAIVGAVFGGIGALPGAALGALGGAVFSIVSHVVGWGLMQIREIGLEHRGDPILAIQDQYKNKYVINKDNVFYVPPEHTITASRDEDTKEYANWARIIGIGVGILASIGVSAAAESAISGATAAGTVDDVANSGDDIANSVDDIVNSADDVAKNLRLKYPKVAEKLVRYASENGDDVDDILSMLDEISDVEGADELIKSFESIGNKGNYIGYKKQLEETVKIVREYGKENVVLEKEIVMGSEKIRPDIIVKGKKLVEVKHWSPKTFQKVDIIEKFEKYARYAKSQGLTVEYRFTNGVPEEIAAKMMAKAQEMGVKLVIVTP